MNRLLLFCMGTILFSCSVKERDRNLAIVVQSNQSYRYELDKGIMTVYYLSKHPTEIKFHLSDKERAQIIDRYYALGLDRLPAVTHLEDECMVMPELTTTIHVKSASRTQKIQIEEDCNRFVTKDIINAGRVQLFLEAVWKILSSKPAIKTAPTSDIFYI